MEKYIELHRYPTDVELEVVPEYAIILNEAQMKQYLEACKGSIRNVDKTKLLDNYVEENQFPARLL